MDYQAACKHSECAESETPFDPEGKRDMVVCLVDLHVKQGWDGNEGDHVTAKASMAVG